MGNGRYNKEEHESDKDLRWEKNKQQHNSPLTHLLIIYLHMHQMIIYVLIRLFSPYILFLLIILISRQFYQIYYKRHIKDGVLVLMFIHISEVSVILLHKVCLCTAYPYSNEIIKEASPLCRCFRCT